MKWYQGGFSFLSSFSINLLQWVLRGWITPKGHFHVILSCHPSQCLESNFCHSPLLAMLQPYFPLFPNMSSSLTWGILHLLFCLKLSHHSGISSNITSSVRPFLTTLAPLANHTLCHYPVLFSFKHFFTIGNYLICLLSIIPQKGSRKAGL